MEQKRLYRRFDINGKIDLETDDGMKKVLGAYLGDMGLGGFRMYSQEKIDSDKNVNFALMTPFLDRPLSGSGKIRHIKTERLHGTNLFSVGVQFTQVNKNKTKQIINKALGWGKKRFLSRQNKRQLYLMLKFLPLAILFTWVVVRSIVSFSYEGYKERQYREKLKEAVIYYLYK